jgi:hypothetical protein
MGHTDVPRFSSVVRFREVMIAFAVAAKEEDFVTSPFVAVTI